jgi:D-alanyl-D-alanine carboxypeptidase
MERYPGMDGMKTGYVAASGFNLVSSAVQGDTRLIGVVYGGKTAARRDDYMAKLLDQSFEIAHNDEVHSSPRYAGTVMQPTMANLAPPAPPEAPPSSQTTPAEVAAAQAPNQDDPAPAPPAETKREDTVAEDKVEISNQWAVQIGAFHSRREAQRALTHAQTNYHNLHDSAPVIATVKTRHGRLYQARLTGLSQPNAVNACGALQARGHSCVTVKPTG